MKKTAKRKKSKPYRFLGHTADLLLAARGASKKALFINAARGMLSYIAVPLEPRPKKCRNVSVRGTNDETLLVRWLNELLYLAYSRRLGIEKIMIHTIDRNHVAAEVSGRMMRNGHAPAHEIKAATYHGLSITRAARRYSAKILFDL